MLTVTGKASLLLQNECNYAAVYNFMTICVQNLANSSNTCSNFFFTKRLHTF